MENLVKFIVKTAQCFRLNKDSLIGNAQELCTVLDGLNITNDPAITALALRISDELIHPPSVLRNNPVLRAQVAAAANNILDTLP